MSQSQHWQNVDEIVFALQTSKIATVHARSRCCQSPAPAFCCPPCFMQQPSCIGSSNKFPRDMQQQPCNESNTNLRESIAQTRSIDVLGRLKQPTPEAFSPSSIIGKMFRIGRVGHLDSVPIAQGSCNCQKRRCAARGVSK